MHKTGTTSLAVALAELGYTVCGVRQDMAPLLEAGDLDGVFAAVEGFDAFRDNPWAMLYEEFDRRYRGARFILTIRDEAQWIASAVGHFGREDTPLRTWIYGVGHPVGNEDIYRARFRRHNQEVLDYFRDRPDDLLILDWSRGDGWAQLCGFLGAEVPTGMPFPHANKRNRSSARPGGLILQRLLRRVAAGRWNPIRSGR